MTFPYTALDQRVELLLGGVWTDVSAYVFQRDPITISRGREEGAGYVDTGSMRLSFDNSDYRFSPRNPTGAYYGQLGRNTPIRCSVALGSAFYRNPAVTGACLYAADSAPLSITGDTEVIVDVELDDWAGYVGLASKSGTWTLYAWGGLLWFRTTSSAPATRDYVSTAYVPVPINKRCAVKVTLDVDNGAAGSTVTFYTAPTADSATWTQLGAPVVVAGAYTLADSIGRLFAGAEHDVSSYLVSGRLYRFVLKNGIAGTAVANVDMSLQTVGATSFVDSAGVTFTVGSPGSVSNRRFRFHGEVAEWPIRSDVSGKDRYVSIEANGVFRRLGRCTSSLPSVIARNYVDVVAGVKAYWPVEDEVGSEQVASGLDRGRPMAVSGKPEFESYTGFLASKPLPMLRLAMFSGSVKSYAATGYIQLRFFLAIPAAGSVGGAELIRMYTTGDVAHWDLRYGTGAGGAFAPGRLRLLAYDAEGTAVFDTGATYLDYELDGKLVMVHVAIDPSAGTPDVDLFVTEVGSTIGVGYTFDHTISDLGRVTSVMVNPDKSHDDVAIGHISVQDVITNLFDAKVLATGYRYETAGRRIARLCLEAGVAFESRGDLDTSEQCGVQSPDSLLNLLRETAEADGGILFESRDTLGLAYTPRRAMYATTTAVTLNVTASHHVADPLDPVDDDSLVVNDVTVSRKNGSSARVAIDSGALSTANPPNGVGRYDQATTLCLADDLRCVNAAWWLVSRGTFDGARYPAVTVNLARPVISSSVSMVDSLLGVDQGYRMLLTGLPPDQPPDDVALLVWGTQEVLESNSYRIRLACVPEGTFDVGSYGGTSSRYDSLFSSLGGAYSSSATSLSVAVSGGQLWTTVAGDCPFDVMVAGERMTVTAVSGSSSPQTFTVTRSVNGVVKAQVSGAAVSLFRPVYYGL